MMFIILLCFHGSFAWNPESPAYLDYLRKDGRDEEFARVMGLPDVRLVRSQGGNQSESEDPIFQRLSSLGDIILTKRQLEENANSTSVRNIIVNKWKNHEVPFYLSLSDYSESERLVIQKAYQDMSACHPNVQIRPWKSADEDYIYIFSGEGCWSFLGRIGGKQLLSLNKTACLGRKGTIQHEMMHALGFIHEHNRPDRDNYVKVLFENIPKEWQSQYQKATTHELSILSYEYGSVKHYPLNAPGTNKPAFEILDKSVDKKVIGQRKGITELDCEKINTVYKE